MPLFTIQKCNGSLNLFVYVSVPCRWFVLIILYRHRRRMRIERNPRSCGHAPFMEIKETLYPALLYRAVSDGATAPSRGSQRDVVYLGWPLAPSYMSQNVCEGRGGVAWSQPMSTGTAVHINFGDLTPNLTYGSYEHRLYCATVCPVQLSFHLQGKVVVCYLPYRLESCTRHGSR
jgi:hypothetical protein